MDKMNTYDYLQIGQIARVAMSKILTRLPDICNARIVYHELPEYCDDLSYTSGDFLIKSYPSNIHLVFNELTQLVKDCTKNNNNKRFSARHTKTKMKKPKTNSKIVKKTEKKDKRKIKVKVEVEKRSKRKVQKKGELPVILSQADKNLPVILSQADKNLPVALVADVEGELEVKEVVNPEKKTELSDSLKPPKKRNFYF